MRYTWQRQRLAVNRVWKSSELNYEWKNPNFDPDKYLDDDILGFMHAEGAQLDDIEDNPEPSTRKGRARPKGTAVRRRGALDVTPAVSTRPFHGDITFNARSGGKDSNSLYATERHATYYQYGFCLSPEYLKHKYRILQVLDGLAGIDKVAGNHGRFLFDFAPTNIVLRWTKDLSPRLLYCFDQDEQEQLSLSDLVYKVESGDINAQELWIGGQLTQELKSLEDRGAKLFPGIVLAVNALKDVIVEDLKISTVDLAKDLDNDTDE